MEPGPSAGREYARRVIASLPAAGQVILDVGCGKSGIAAGCSPPGSFVLGIDIDRATNSSIVAGAGCLPVRSGSCDAAVILALLEHLKEPWTAFGEAHRVLRPGGLVAGYVPFIYPYHGHPIDCYRFTSTGLKSLLRGFSSVEIEPMGDYSHVILGFLTGFRLAAIRRLSPLCPIIRAGVLIAASLSLGRARARRTLEENCLGFFFTARR